MRHEFAFDASYRLPAMLFGVTPRTSWVEVGPTDVWVRYGPWRLRTSLANVESAEQTGGFAWLKTAGPPHLSLSDRGISFTPNGRAALCLRFRDPVRAIDPTGLAPIRHPGAALGVSDPAALWRDLQAAGARV